MAVNSGIARRTFLRGCGAAIALPWLEAMRMPASAAAVTSAGAPPTRMAFLYVPNGIHMQTWRPDSEGQLGELPPTLAPLQGVKDELLVLSGLAQNKASANGDGPGDHARSAATFLTGEQAVKTDGKDIRAGVSVDQIAAKHLGADTRFPSLELGCDPGRLAGTCDSGYSCAYTSNISWRSPTSPATKEHDPRLVFDRLFGGANSEGGMERTHQQRKIERRSVLDFVSEDARRLEKRISVADRRRVDEYLEGIRAVERRLDSGPADDVVEFRRPDEIPGKAKQHIGVMTDLLVLAFQADLTRVATVMFADEGSQRTFPDIGVREGHHSASHHQRREENYAMLRKIDLFYVELLASFLGRLKDTPEGEGSLLDHSMIVYGSGIGDGNRHNHNDLPILLAGRGGGVIDSGRHIQYPKDTPLMNLYLSMLQATDAPYKSLGDSTGVLDRLGA